MLVTNLIRKIEGENTNTAIKDKWIENELTKIQSGKKILDAGAGQLRWKSACAHLEYVSQDFCEYEGMGNGKGLQHNNWDTSKIDIISDIVAIPVPNDSFDAILCTEVLEHIPYPHEAIREFSRILKPGGVLLLTAPFNSLTHFAPYHFATGFNYYWYEKILNDYGFDIQVSDNNGGYFDYMRQEVLRLPEMAEKYANYNSKILKGSCLLLVMLINKLIARDKGSKELGTFQYMVKAVKKV